MCGILGILPPVAEAKFKPILDLLAHRGPDGYGIWTETSQITLGHRRLSILDLSDAGVQPMHTERYAITFNGEVYNFLEIRNELIAKGYIFQSKTDTEVVLKAWECWQGDCFAKFNGMWALAIWDKLKKKLILSRDRYGQKPLFYAFLNNRVKTRGDGTMEPGFAFASEMKALIPFLPEVEPDPEFHWMKTHLFEYEPTEICLIKGIKRFPAASWAEIELSELQNDPTQTTKLNIQKYYHPLEHIHYVPKAYKDQVIEFRELFLDACRIRMRADVPMGTALSGGIDSSATICSMAHIAKTSPEKGFPNDWQHAFVASMPGTPLDETPYAKIVTDHLGIRSSFVKIDPVAGIDDLEKMLFQFEELYITSPVPMVQTYAAARSEGVFVTLDGHGADELFAGYDTFLFHAFKDCGLNPFAIRNILRTYRSLSPLGEPQFQKPEVGFVNYLRFVTGRDNPGSLKGHLTKEIKKIFEDPRTVKIKADLAFSTGKEGPEGGRNGNRTIQEIKKEDLGALNSELFDLYHTTNLPTLLRNYDRYSMYSGVEIRMPFLDYRVASYCLSVPWNSKLRNGYTKSLLRDAIGDLMPVKVVKRKYKMGFQTPIVNWLQGPWKPYFMDLIHSQAFRETGFVDPITTGTRIQALIQNSSALYREGELAYAALSPFLWEISVLQPLRKLHTRLKV